MKKISKRDTQIQIIEEIVNYININNLKVGDKLPGQMQIAEMLGVSRPTLREAIKYMEAKGVVETINGKGVYVLQNSLPRIKDIIKINTEKDTLIELFQVRKALEHEMIQLVYENATKKEMQEMKDVLDILIEKYNKGERQTLEDKDFHMRFYRACHNELMMQLIDFIGSSLEKIWKTPLGLSEPFTESVPQHKSMFTYLMQGKIKEAQEVNDKMMDKLIKEIKEFKVES